MLAFLTSNPLYLTLLILCSRLVQNACAPSETSGWRLPFWRISVVILLFSTFFNVLTAHVGQTVLFALPGNWPLIGGPFTLEAALYGFLNGLRLIALLSFFMTFNTIVPVSQLTGLVPGALHETALVVLIAITFVPETIRQFKRIRDAQSIRGHRLSGIRAWRPIVIPLLITALERALNLAETMVARGYGSTTTVSLSLRTRLLFIVGLMLAFGGALQSAWARPGGVYFIAGGVAAVAWAYNDLSRRYKRTKYHLRVWTTRDSLVVVAALVPLILLLLPGVDRSVLTYFPYPMIAPPEFNLWIGLSLIGLVIPAVLIQIPSAIGGRL
jgi:energy-coupling factor transport system permease protein